LPLPAQAIDYLIYDDAVAWLQVVNTGSDGLDQARDLVSENLRLLGQRDRLSMIVGVVVAVAAEDVEISTAQACSRHAHQDV